MVTLKKALSDKEEQEQVMVQVGVLSQAYALCCMLWVTQVGSPEGDFVLGLPLSPRTFILLHCEVPHYMEI